MGVNGLLSELNSKNTEQHAPTDKKPKLRRVGDLHMVVSWGIELAFRRLCIDAES